MDVFDLKHRKRRMHMIGCLILHGYTGSPYEVDPLVQHLKKHTDWAIEVPTLPGHGDKLHLDDVCYKDWLNTAEESFLHLKETSEKIYIIGFSMGGMIAAYLAAKYEIEKLVLLAPAGKYLSMKHLGQYVGDVISDGVKGKLNENEKYLRYKHKIGEVPLKANIEFMRLVKFTRQFLKKVKVPVLIVHGQQDGLVPTKTGYYLDKEIGSTEKEIVFFERSDHLLCLGDDKEILNDLVLNFLNKKAKAESPSNFVSN